MSQREQELLDDLAWLATCYVTGELSVAEQAAFEARLESDLAACEAVAQATQRNLVIAAAFDHSPSEAVRPASEVVAPRSRVAATAMTLAAMAALVVGFVWMLGKGQSTDRSLARQATENRVVAVWALGEAVRNAREEEASLLVSAADDDLDPPDWMLSALEAAYAKAAGAPETTEVREN